MSNDGTIQSVENTIRILEAMRRARGDYVGVTTLAEDLGLSKSTVHKHLRTLAANHLVVSENGAYRLSFEVFKYGSSLRDNHRLCSLARPALGSLGDETGKLVLFGIKERNSGVFVDAANDNFGFTDSLIGTRYHLHCSATGKAMLSRCSREEIADVATATGLPAMTEGTITDEEALHEAVEETRERGYAINDQERTEFVSIAAPVSDPKTGSLGAISVASPPKQTSLETLIEEEVDALLGAINELEIQLRYTKT